MSRFEYKVVPAPSKGAKAKGVKSAEARFSLTVEATLNDLATQGWEYVRAELLPSEERSGLTGSTTNWRNVLIFRRAIETPESAPAPQAEEIAAPRPVVIPEDPEAELPPIRAIHDDAPTGAPEVTIEGTGEAKDNVTGDTDAPDAPDAPRG